ncbi:outer membrane beta-barrel protein [Dysgonomonas sp. 511]|uniref:outer membrane beta-barrel protein n=1 Tax=Dysgonomonas sp. 511 TaxID=2302930 RepID=UPI0013D4C20F|nr:outer membrane beta-barrel protein [Dysgonomonas sp. 511]NDV78800.1 PorT family protein [Dysgonomonas sp. 511]
MKTLLRILILSGLLLLSINGLYAQRVKKKFTTDFHMGLNFAEMDIQGANKYKEPKLGMFLGANLNFKILGNVQIQTGFWVTKRGLKQHIEEKRVDNGTNTVYMGDTIRETAASYLQVPLCLGYEVFLTKKFAVNFNVGGYLAYGFKGNHHEEGIQTVVQDGVEMPQTLTVFDRETFGLSYWNRWDYGAIAKVGFVYDIYTVNFSYEHGFYNVSGDPNQPLKNRNKSVSVGFRF